MSSHTHQLSCRLKFTTYQAFSNSPLIMPSQIHHLSSILKLTTYHPFQTHLLSRFRKLTTYPSFLNSHFILIHFINPPLILFTKTHSWSQQYRLSLNVTIFLKLNQFRLINTPINTHHFFNRVKVLNKQQIFPHVLFAQVSIFINNGRPVPRCSQT